MNQGLTPLVLDPAFAGWQDMLEILFKTPDTISAGAHINVYSEAGGLQQFLAHHLCTVFLKLLI